MNEPIAVSKELEEMFKSRNVEITFYPDKVTKKFKTFRSFYTCINEETEFWLKYRNDTNLSNIYGHFAYVLNALNMALSSTSSQHMAENIDSAINNANIRRFPCVYSFTGLANKLETLVNQNVNARIIQGFMIYLEQGIFHPGDRDLLLGEMDAYRTLYPYCASEDLNEQTNGLNALKETLLRETEEFRSRYETTSNSIEDEYKIFTDTMRNWKDKEESSYQQFRNERASELKNLEETYREKLKLEAPVQYWIDSKDQNLTRQLGMLEDCSEIFVEKYSEQNLTG